MATPNPPVILPQFNDATARLKVQLAEDAWNTRDRDRGLTRRRNASINDYPIAAFERRIALPSQPAMRISQLWRYPVKSMGGERLERAWLGLSGIPGDRVLYVLDGRGEILSARTKPRLLGHQATLGEDGEVLVDGLPWRSAEVAAAVRAAAGPDARLVPAAGPERFDILPLLVATDGAIKAFGYDLRRLRPNVVISGVDGLAERHWEWSLLAAGDAVIALADLRGRCIVTTWHPDTLTQDVDVLRRIRRHFDGTLALNAWAGREGHVTVGDQAEILEQRIELGIPEPGRFASMR